MLVWLTAARFPTVRVRTAITASMGSHTSRAAAKGASGPWKSRSRKANEAAPDATERGPDKVGGAPWSGPGPHKGKGAAKILNSGPGGVRTSARKPPEP